MLHASRLDAKSLVATMLNQHKSCHPRVFGRLELNASNKKKRLPSVNSRSAKLFSYATTTRELLQPSNVSLFLVFVWGPVLDFENVLNTNTGFHILSIFARHGALRSCNEGGVNPNQPCDTSAPHRFVKAGSKGNRSNHRVPSGWDLFLDGLLLYSVSHAMGMQSKVQNLFGTQL